MKMNIGPLTTMCLLAVASVSHAQSDRGSVAATVTAEQQGTTQGDMELTRDIRRELMSRKLSVSAQNVTVVTRNGVITLRGKVASLAEQNTVAEIARSLAKGATVQNELTVRK